MTSPMLDKLEDERVFEMKRGDAGHVELVEACDNRFECVLTKDELLQLVAEMMIRADAAGPLDLRRVADLLHAKRTT